jgi:putative colanic acid biosynthesis acetyltransferase WcaF
MKLRTFTASHFDRGAPRWKEALWVVTRCLFFQTPVPFPTVWKCLLLKLFGGKIGSNVVIRASIFISFPWRLVIGDDVWIGDGVWILSLAPVIIESNVCVSQKSFLCTGSHDYRKESFELITRPIHIKEGSWIAASTFVGPGVQIGPNSVVAAGSVVTKSVGRGELVRGNPAQFVKRVIPDSEILETN